MNTRPDTARAHVSPPPKAEPQHTPRPDCIACGGLGKIHVQVPGEFRTASVPCQCWRLV